MILSRYLVFVTHGDTIVPNRPSPCLTVLEDGSKFSEHHPSKNFPLVRLEFSLENGSIKFHDG